jgi:hypothetical protein
MRGSFVDPPDPPDPPPDSPDVSWCVRCLRCGRVFVPTASPLCHSCPAPRSRPFVLPDWDERLDDSAGIVKQEF